MHSDQSNEEIVWKDVLPERDDKERMLAILRATGRSTAVNKEELKRDMLFYIVTEYGSMTPRGTKLVDLGRRNNVVAHKLHLKVKDLVEELVAEGKVLIFKRKGSLAVLPAKEHKTLMNFYGTEEHMQLEEQNILDRTFASS